MRSVFNTPFEISLRVLLILCVNETSPITLDMITAIDFLAVYARSFGLADENLHGDSVFSFSEFATRRELVQEALRALVLDGLVHVLKQGNGFHYSICSEGRMFCESLTTDYAFEYRDMARTAFVYVTGKTERDVMTFINQCSTMSLGRGVRNG